MAGKTGGAATGDIAGGAGTGTWGDSGAGAESATMLCRNIPLATARLGLPDELLHRDLPSDGVGVGVCELLLEATRACCDGDSATSGGHGEGANAVGASGISADVEDGSADGGALAAADVFGAAGPMAGSVLDLARTMSRRSSDWVFRKDSLVEDGIADVDAEVVMAATGGGGGGAFFLR